jgi:hypothetical protein
MATEKVTLHHYTAPVTSHLGSILQEGWVRTTESNLSAVRSHAGPDVVWLTDSTDPKAQAWATGSAPPGDPVLKSAAVLVVELPAESVFHWPGWSKEQGIEPTIYEGLADTGGDPASWWVTTRPITRWDITALVIAPLVVHGETFPKREYAGAELRRLFESAGARRALKLPETRAREILVEGGGA